MLLLTKLLFSALFGCQLLSTTGSDPLAGTVLPTTTSGNFRAVRQQQVVASLVRLICSHRGLAPADIPEVLRTAADLEGLEA